MRPLFLALSLLTIFSCRKKDATEKGPIAQAYVKEVFVVPPMEVTTAALDLHQNEGTWYCNGEVYNGYATKYYPNGTTEEKWGFYKGKREGVARRWSENGVLRVQSYYHQNKLVGDYTTWWENGAMAEVAYYENGMKQGDEKQWYPNGQLAKWRHLVNDKEDGLQKAWLKNGKLYVNYEAKNGRIFGMKRANLCYQLEDEVIAGHE